MRNAPTRAANTHQLDQNVERRARSVLERVADGVTNDGGIVLRGVLHLVLAKTAGGDVLLGVVPSTTSVRSRDGHLDTRDQGASKQTGKGLNAEQEADDDGREHDERARGDHLHDEMKLSRAKPNQAQDGRKHTSRSEASVEMPTQRA